MANLTKKNRQQSQTLNDLSQLADLPAVAVTSNANDAVILPKDAHFSPDEQFMYVTSHKLRRSVIKGNFKHAKLLLPMDVFRRLTAIGMANGVTWDEVLRAAIDREFTSIEPFKGALEFLPVPATDSTQAA
ncbi:hypothetical protein [Mucilaginibacter defluvii]|uniref:Uncharacterized protein n=1 Tax=Mucilaginibacter defluvii TaxID=1196019 RepID=A0ABP9FSI9_9SPHI